MAEQIKKPKSQKSSSISSSKDTPPKQKKSNPEKDRSKDTVPVPSKVDTKQPEKTKKNSSTIDSPENKSDSNSTISFSKELQIQIDPVKKIEAEFEQLSVLEKHIITIAKSVLKKKRYEATISTQRPENMSPLVEELYDKCVAKLTHTRGYPREEIFKTIKKLHEEKWIITDQRRTRQEILGSETLRQVLEFIHEHPGTHARNEQIQDQLKITRNPFIKHVMVLEAFGLIRSKKIGRTLNYFVTDLPEKYDEFVVLFANPMVPEIIYEFIQDGDISLSEIARKLDVYHGAIQYHVKKMKSMAILIKKEDKWVINRTLLRDYNKMFDVPPFTKHF